MSVQTGCSRPKALSVSCESVPEELRAINRWVCWRFVKKKKPDGSINWAKVPFTVTGQHASSTNPKTWASYDDVEQAYMLDDFDGIGLVLGDDVQGIDLDDVRDPVTGELLPIAQEVLDKVEGYAEISPSGTGIKVFSRTNLDASRTKKEAGVELYREGRYFTVTGHAINGHARLPAEVQDLGWLVEKLWGDEIKASTDASERALELYKAPLEGWDADRIRQEIGPHLDLEMHYEEWIRVGQALYHQFEGDDEGFELWDELFQDSPKYGGHEYGWERWRSFNAQRARGRGPVTLASILKMTKDQRRTGLLEEFKQKIETCSDARGLQEQVAAKIANTPEVSEMEREILAAAIQGRAKDLGVKLPIATARGWVKSRSSVTQSQAMPEWAQPWVYITEGDKFFNTDTKQEVTSKGFCVMFNRNMPFDTKGNREQADRWAVERWGMPVVSHKAYIPNAGLTFQMFGRQWVNLYRPESVPDVPHDYSPEDLDAIDTVKRHFEVFLANERDRALLLSFVAHNVQQPGVKVRWAPYVHGVQGDGKSFFSELAAVAMGGQNVRSLNGSTLESNFTDWAVGYALVAIEEMKQHGQNKYDIMNRLKTFITNSQIEIHPKGKASYTAPNVSNYIIFSNYLDGAPVDEGDRRYMFLSSRLTTAEAQRLTQEDYFKRLFDAIHGHQGAIRKWLLGYQLHQEFDANGRAPDTDVKRTVVEMNKGDLEPMAEDVIERGAEGVTKTVISSAHLIRALVSAGAEAPSTTRVNTLLTRLGYLFAMRKKWKGEACRVWLQQGLTVTDSDVVTTLITSADAAADFLQ
jgi:hypothetical protein